MATTTLSNVSYVNNEYIVSSSNAFGSIKVNQPTTTNYYIEMKADIPTSRLHNYTMEIGDTTSNLKINLSNNTLLVKNITSNLFSTSNIGAYLSTGYNKIAMNKLDNVVVVSLNSTNIVRITNSNELPKYFNNSYMKIEGSNSHKFKDISFNPQQQ